MSVGCIVVGESVKGAGGAFGTLLDVGIGETTGGAGGAFGIMLDVGIGEATGGAGGAFGIPDVGIPVGSDDG